MQHIEIRSEPEIKKIIREVFTGDPGQRENFVFETEEQSIADTSERNIGSIKEHGAKFYQLVSDQGRNTVGFINVIPKFNMLYSFGLKYGHRSKENKEAFGVILNALLPGETLACSLYLKNERGIRFLEKFGFERQETITLLKNRNK